MNAVLWILQATLALIFLFGASTRAVAYEFAKQRMAWVSAVPRSLLLFISGAEILGAVGLVLPKLTGVATPLTPFAAIGLGVILVLAFAFHLSRHERQNAGANVVLLGLLMFVAVGRFTLATG